MSLCKPVRVSSAAFSIGLELIRNAIEACQGLISSSTIEPENLCKGGKTMAYQAHIAFEAETRRIVPVP